MEFRSILQEDTYILHLTGDLIGANQESLLLQAIDDTIETNIIKCVINISELRYINSTGIGILITILTKFRNKGGEVYLVNPSDSVKKLLIITKLNAIFNITTSVDNAIKQLKEIQ